MLKSPFDIAIIFAIVGLIVVTIGFGIQSVEDLGATTQNTTFFSDVRNNLENETGLKGTSDEASQVIDPSDDPVTTEATEENIITQGLQSLRSLGATYKSVEAVMNDGTKELGIDAIYWSTIAAVLIIIVFVIIYTWARGR